MPTETPTPGTIDEQLKSYGVVLTGDWSPQYKSYILSAVKTVDQRLSNEMDLPPTSAFVAVYGDGFEFHFGCSYCDGLAYTYSDHIDWSGFFANWYSAEHPDTNVHLVIHELGHAFDQKVCAVLGGSCDDITKGPLRTKLAKDIETFPYLKRTSYGDAGESPPFSGFAGGKNDWQFSLEGQVSFVGEIWADMYLGWIYGTLATDRKNYMNTEMQSYLGLFK